MSLAENSIDSTPRLPNDRKFGSVLSVNTPALSQTKLKCRKNLHHTTGSLKKRHSSNAAIIPGFKSKSVNGKEKENAKDKQPVTNLKKDNEKKTKKMTTLSEPMETITEEELDNQIDTYLQKQSMETESAYKWITSPTLDDQDVSTVNYHLNLVIARYRALLETWKENEQLQKDIDSLREENELYNQQIQKVNEIRSFLEMDNSDNEEVSSA